MKAVIILLAAMLAGCGEKAAEREEARPQAAPAAEAADDRPVILALGDSITAGHGVEPGQTYPDLLQRALDERGYRYRVVNAGVSGDTSSGGLARLPSLLELKPKAVILELGGNDGLRGLPVETTRANLEEMIVSLQGAGAKVLLAGMTLPGNYGPDFIGQFERMYEELARKHKLTLVPFRLEKIAGAGEQERLMQRDGIHPTAEGYRRLAPYLIQYLEPVLER